MVHFSAGKKKEQQNLTRFASQGGQPPRVLPRSMGESFPQTPWFDSLPHCAMMLNREQVSYRSLERLEKWCRRQNLTRFASQGGQPPRALPRSMGESFPQTPWFDSSRQKQKRPAG